jgi:RNA polymerase sigma-70 factor (ECF subfamily)
MTMDEILSLTKPFSLNIEERRCGSPQLEDFVTDLYVKLRPSLISYIFHLTGSTRDAEDVVQITFLQLFDQLNGNAEIRNIRGWLYRVAHNLAIEELRTAGRREALFKRWFADYERTSAPQSAEADLIRRDQIERSLQTLNEKERRCLMLRAEGLSYQEIAEVVDMSAKSVSVYLARGLRKFESKNED